MRTILSVAIAAAIVALGSGVALAQTASPPRSANSAKGKTLVDAKGMTLYILDRDTTRRQIDLQRAMRHQLAAADGFGGCQGRRRMDGDHPRRRRQAVGLQGQAAVFLEGRQEGRRRRRRRPQQRLAYRRALIAVRLHSNSDMRPGGRGCAPPPGRFRHGWVVPPAASAPRRACHYPARLSLPSAGSLLPSMNIRLAILIKLFSVLLFAVMSTLVRFVGDVRAAGTGGVLPQRLCDRSGGVDLCVARRDRLGGADRTAARPSHPRPDQRRQHVPQLRRAGAPAAGRCHCDFLRRPVHHRRARRRRSARAGPRLSLVGGCGRVCRSGGDVVALSRCGHAARRRLDRDHGRGGLRRHRGLHQCRRGDPDAASHRQRDHRLDRVLLLADLHAGRALHLAVRLGYAERDANWRRSSRSA